MLLLGLLLAVSPLVSALGQRQIVSFDAPQNASAAFALVSAAGPPPVFVDGGDWPGVHIAARTFAKGEWSSQTAGRSVPDHRNATDILAVSGQTMDVSSLNGTLPASPSAIIVGSLDSSDLIRRLAASGKIDTTAVQGKWEAFHIQTVRDIEGVASALVIFGAE